MDRQIVLVGQVPLDTDLLSTNKNAMIGLAKLAEATFGTATVVQGFSCGPTIPASLAVTIGAGQIYSLENIDENAFGALSADTAHSIVKQGVMLDPDVLTFAAPTTVGFVQNFLIQAEFDEIDGGQVTRPYVNAANPTGPTFSGPGNSGSKDNTVRQGLVSLTVKAGIAAASGTQTTPAPDAGYVGLYVVIVAAGQTTVTVGNISTYANAPFLPVTLPQVPAGVQSGKWTYCDDTGTGDAMILTPTPLPAAIGKGFSLKFIKGASPNATIEPEITVETQAGPATFQVSKSDGTAVSIGDLRGNAALLIVHDGLKFRAVGFFPSDIPQVNQNIVGTEGVIGSGMNVKLNFAGLTPTPKISDTDGFAILATDTSDGEPAGHHYLANAAELASYVFSKAPVMFFNATTNSSVVGNDHVYTPLPGWGGITKTFVNSTFDGGTFTVGKGEAGIYIITVFISTASRYDQATINVYQNQIELMRDQQSDINAANINNFGAIGVSTWAVASEGDTFWVQYAQDNANNADRTFVQSRFGIIRIPFPL